MAGAEAFADEQFFGVYADGHGRYRATVGGHYRHCPVHDPQRHQEPLLRLQTQAGAALEEDGWGSADVRRTRKLICQLQQRHNL